MSSRIWILRSDCSSVCGWYAVLNFSHVPMLSWRLLQKWDINLVSLSDTMLIGTPCSRTTSCRYFSANNSVDCPSLNGMKWAVFVRWSTITHTAVFPFGLRDSALTKSIAIPTYTLESVKVKESSHPLMFCLHLLTHQTLCYITSNLSLHSLLPELLLQVLVHLCSSLMYGICWFMSFRQNFLSNISFRYTNSVTKTECPISMDLHIRPQSSLHLISKLLYLRVPTLSLLDLL